MAPILFDDGSIVFDSGSVVFASDPEACDCCDGGGGDPAPSGCPCGAWPGSDCEDPGWPCDGLECRYLVELDQASFVGEPIRLMSDDSLVGTVASCSDCDFSEDTVLVPEVSLLAQQTCRWVGPEGFESNLTDIKCIEGDWALTIGGDMEVQLGSSLWYLEFDNVIVVVDATECSNFSVSWEKTTGSTPVGTYTSQQLRSGAGLAYSPGTSWTVSEVVS